MVSLARDGDSVVVTVEGMHRLLALKGSIRIPIWAIVSAERAEVDHSIFGKGLRLPGTHVPGWVIAGSFYKGGEWHFWDMVDPQGAIEIRTSEGRYRRIIVEVEDPEQALAFIRALQRTAYYGGGPSDRPR